MTGTRLRWLFQAIILVAAVAAAKGQSAYEPNLEIRTSRIPHAGNGVFTKVAIPKGAYLGAYTGEYITEEEVLAAREGGPVAVHDGSARLRETAHRGHRHH